MQLIVDIYVLAVWVWLSTAIIDGVCKIKLEVDQEFYWRKNLILINWFSLFHFGFDILLYLKWHALAVIFQNNVTFDKQFD